MERLMNRLIQGRRGTLGAIRTQTVHCHELALQGFIQRFMQRLWILERLMTRYGWGLRQQDGIALRFNLNRVEAISPGESPEALWLSLQSRLPRFNRTAAQEDQSSVPENSISQLSNQDIQVRRRITSQRVEESFSDSENYGRSPLTMERNSAHIPLLGSTDSNSDVLSEGETFRVRRGSLRSTEIAEMPSLFHRHAGEMKAIAKTPDPPLLINASSDDQPALKPIVPPTQESMHGSPRKPMSKPAITSIVGEGFAKGSTSQQKSNSSTLPLQVARTATGLSQHPALVQPKQSSPRFPTEIDNAPRVLSKPKNNYFPQSSPDFYASEAIARNEPLPLAKSSSPPAIAESPFQEQAPLPLAMPKHHSAKENRDRPTEGVEPSVAPKNAANTVPEVTSISPATPVMNPINVEKITEQVSRQIFRQLKLERERRGIYS
jgi:hypothetical protein